MSRLAGTIGRLDLPAGSALARSVARHSNRETLLAHGLRVIHHQGYEASSVRDIVQAAGVPQGSFTNHFASKEAFGLAVIDLYTAYSDAMVRETLANATLAPLARLRAYFDAQIAMMKRDAMRGGCLYGNFSAEASSHSEPIRTKVVAALANRQRAVAAALTAALDAGELAPLDVEAVAGFLVSSLQGAILVSKAQRSLAPLEQLTSVVFASVLRPPG
jgi:TetR/AcrR family transcriptional repressor of nem operon